MGAQESPRSAPGEPSKAPEQFRRDPGVLGEPQESPRRALKSPRRAQESPRKAQESPRTTRRQLGNQEEQIELHMSVGPPVLVSLTFLRHPPPRTYSLECKACSRKAKLSET